MDLRKIRTNDIEIPMQEKKNLSIGMNEIVIQTKNEMQEFGKVAEAISRNGTNYIGPLSIFGETGYRYCYGFMPSEFDKNDEKKRNMVLASATEDANILNYCSFSINLPSYNIEQDSSSGCNVANVVFDKKGYPFAQQLNTGMQLANNLGNLEGYSDYFMCNKEGMDYPLFSVGELMLRVNDGQAFYAPNKEDYNTSTYFLDGGVVHMKNNEIIKFGEDEAFVELRVKKQAEFLKKYKLGRVVNGKIEYDERIVKNYTLKHLREEKEK